MWLRTRGVARHPWVRRTSVLVVFSGVVALALSVASASGAGYGVAFSYDSTYQALTNPETTPTGFEQPGFDDSSWTASQAPFSSSVGSSAGCGFAAGNSSFPVNGTVYVRKSFMLPSNAYGLHIVGTIDNNADVYVNGHLEGQVENGFCQHYGDGSGGGIDIHVPNTDLVPGAANLVAVKAVDTGSITFFDMQATYGTLAFSQQPTETQALSPITPAPTVTVTDADGNPVVNTPVSVTLQAISGSGAFTAGSTTTVSTDSSGVATFSNLAVTDTGKYQLVASSGGSSTTSTGFLVANQVTPCQGSCSASGSVTGSTMTQATATGAPPGSSLAVSVDASDVTPPPGVCGVLGPLGVGSYVSILNNGSTYPDFTITWTLDKSLVLQAPNPGAAHFDICLGAENLADPGGTHTTGWTTKSGTPAVPVADPGLGVTFFWGIIPDCPNKGRPSGPCALSKNKNKGNEVITFFKPAPWDGHYYGGGP